VLVALGVADAVGLAEEVVVGVNVGVALAVGVGVGVTVGVSVAVSVGSSAMTVGLLLGVGVREGSRLGVMLGVRVGATVGVAWGSPRLQPAVKTIISPSPIHSTQRIVSPLPHIDIIAIRACKQSARRRCLPYAHSAHLLLPGV
jgi:hypothetical protein